MVVICVYMYISKMFGKINEKTTTTISIPGFPESVITMQAYMMLGNSLNVHVVAVLLRLLTLEEG